MKRTLLFLGLVLLLIPSLANAVVVNNLDYTSVFNDSSTEKNLTFTGGENITTYISLPKYGSIDNAQINLSTSDSLNNTWLEVGTPDGSYEFGPATVVLDNLLNRSEDYFLIIHASSLDESPFEVYGNEISQINVGTWVYYNNGTDYEVSRARVFKALFYNNNTSPILLNATSVSKIETPDSRDVGKRGIYATASSSGGPGHEAHITYTGTFTDTSTNYNVSSWSRTSLGSTGDHARWEIESGTTRNSAPAGSASDETEADTSGDVIDNPANVQLDDNQDSNGDAQTKVFFLSSSNLTWVESTVSQTGSPTKVFTNYDYFDHGNIPEMETFNEASLTFNTTARTTNHASVINSYLTGCTADSNGNCQVPYIFHAGSAGVLKVNQINVTTTQYQANFSFKDSLNNNSLSPSCTIDSQSFNYTTFTSFNVTNPRTISCSLFGYQTYSITSTLGNTSLVEAVSLTPRYVNVSILKEVTNTPFPVSGTNSTKLLIYCSQETLEYDFNVSANENTASLPARCAWSSMRLEMSYASTSYYRTLIPDQNETNITFYGIDLDNDLAYQINIKLNDLTGEYTDGTLIVKKNIGGATREIIEQEFDVEGKVVLYLIQNGLYTITVRSNSGQERTLGELIADAAGTKTITIPEIAFTPESFLGDEISWEWARSNTSLIKLLYNDTSNKTTSFTFTVYNGSNTSQVLYTTTSTNLGFSSFTYMTAANSTYLACFNATHSSEGNFDQCTIYKREVPYGQLAGWEPDEQEDLSNWFAILIISFCLLIFGRFHTVVGLSVSTILAWMFVSWGWLDFGNPWINYALLSTGALVTVLTYWIQRGRE